jgi:hypothetical protein
VDSTQGHMLDRQAFYYLSHSTHTFGFFWGEVAWGEVLTLSFFQNKHAITAGVNIPFYSLQSFLEHNSHINPLYPYKT